MSEWETVSEEGWETVDDKELKRKKVEEEIRAGIVAEMNPLQKAWAGFGSTLPRLGQGIQQIFGNDSKELQREVDYSSGALDRLGGWGTTGKIAGNIGLGVPLMTIPGVGGAAGSGLLMGALEPTATGESRTQNALTGGAFGALGYGVTKAIPHVWRGGKALLEPFFKTGQENIAGRTLSSFAGNADEAAKNMAAARELVPGSSPTAGEVSKDAGIAQLQRSLQTQNPQLAAELAERALDQNSARLAAIHELTKYGANLDDALSRRAEAGAKLYEKAFGQKIRVDDKINILTQRPSFKSALERAQRIAEEEGAPINNLFDQEGKFASTRALHYVKMGFDDLINDAPQAGIGKAEINAIKNTRGKLLDWMSENNPSYKTARVRFEKMSRPINREEVAREITSRATRSQLPNAKGETTLYPDSFSRALKDEGEAVVKSVTGRVGKGLDDVMTPKQMNVLENIRNDLGRSVTARDFGRSAGSNTAQNLASQNLLRQIGVPEMGAQNPLMQSLLRPYQFAAKLGEPGIQEVLSQAMLNPAYAASLMGRVKPKVGPVNGLMPRAPRVAGLLAPSIYTAQ